MSEYEARDVGLDEILGLRTALLDPGGEPQISDGDRQVSSLHTAAFHDGRPVGVATIHQQGMPDGRQVGAWRLAAIAVEYGHRGNGVGRLLLERCLRYATDHDAAVVWCIGPEGVTGFFSHHGFERSGDPLEDATGRHHLLQVVLEPLRRSWSL